MEAAGYEIKRGKYISFRAPGQERFTRCKTLGEDYTEQSITERIQGKKQRVSLPKRDDKTVSLLIDIENSINEQQSRGYSQWAKIHNLKQAAKTLNYLTENNILQYADLQAKIAEVTAASDSTGDARKSGCLIWPCLSRILPLISRQSPPMTDTARRGIRISTGKSMKAR